MVRQSSYTIAVLCLLLSVVTTSPAFGIAISWTDWTAATLGTNGSASGTMTIGSTNVGVTYTGQVSAPTQTSGGINYWNPATPYLSSYISNAPGTTDIIALTGTNQIGQVVNTITFDTPLVDPVMALVSLGQPWNNYVVNYRFDHPFDLLSSGQGYWGGNPSGSLMELSGNILQGLEGHGAIKFLGEVTSISWTADPYEYWHGFTVGAAEVAPVPEPSTILLLAGGFLAMGVAGIRRRNART